MARMPALAVPRRVVRPRDRRRVVAVLGLAWLMQRIAQTAGRVAARALETQTFDRPAELLHPGDRRVIAHHVVARLHIRQPWDVGSTPGRNG